MKEREGEESRFRRKTRGGRFFWRMLRGKGKAEVGGAWE